MAADEEVQGFIAPAPLKGGAAPSVFDQLLSGGEDDTRAVEVSEGELASLGEEHRAVVALTREKRRLETRLAKVSAALTDAKLRMQDAMAAQGTRQFNSAVEEDGACSLGTRYDTVVEDPQAFLAWVQSQAPELLTVHSQTRTKFIRENYRDRGIPVESPEFPPGVKVEERQFLQVRGVKDAKE